MTVSIVKSATRALIKPGILFLSLAGVIFFVRFFEIESIQSPAWVESHLLQGGKGIALYLGMVGVFSALGVPRQALSALGGYAFGAFFGTVWASLGLVFGCSCGFFYARFLGRASLQRRFGQRIQRFNAFIRRAPFTLSIAVRCLPVGNNALTNMLAGMTSMPAKSFIAGSGIGYLPQTITFALLGSGMHIDTALRVSLSAVLFAAASFMGIWLYRRFKNAHPPVEDKDML